MVMLIGDTQVLNPFIDVTGVLALDVLDKV
jgi:hypothetical protein